MGEKLLPVPQWIYTMLSSWHQLSFLRDTTNLNTVYEIMCTAENREGLEALYEIVQQNLGFYLYSAINECKVNLSSLERTSFHFHRDGIEFGAVVGRNEFNEWIREEICEMKGALDETLKRAGVSADKIDRVFLTGGTSLVPAVRQIFEELFPVEKIASGNEFTAVVTGLARIVSTQ